MAIPSTSRLAKRVSEPLRPLVGLCADLELGEDPDAILQPLTELYRTLDEALETRAHGLQLPCRPGCDACCHEAVFVSAPEFLKVAAHLLFERSLEARIAINREMQTWALRYEDELELLETIEPGPERDEVALRVKFRCPLLGSDGRCTVYEARELNARTFGQSWDEVRSEPYGCELTHARLRVLPPETGPALLSARAARRRLVDTVPGTERVHVYPWWFLRYGHWLERESNAGRGAPS